MLVRKWSPVSNRFNELDIPVTAEQIAAWNNGALIQDAMPNISASHREFLMSGILPEEWDLMFAEEDDFSDEED